ncbi:hypothetical protein vBCbaSRXM_71 [Citromicrobium phage vB_CbaS-RXM]|nr:hypothetical protein vBCbaSRXM_71 [Citromicrobium phage vB_CbaS-RXM]
MGTLTQDEQVRLAMISKEREQAEARRTEIDEKMEALEVERIELRDELSKLLEEENTLLKKQTA